MVAGVALVRLFPHRWPSLLGGVVLASVVVCGYALLTKVFPGALNPDEIYARLREPFGYWNAVGLMAAAGGAGVPVARRPALGPRGRQRARLSRRSDCSLVALLLAYSRGALLALGVGLRAVVRGRAAAPARRGRAGHERVLRRPRRPSGPSPRTR